MRKKFLPFIFCVFLTGCVTVLDESPEQTVSPSEEAVGVMLPFETALPDIMPLSILYETNSENTARFEPSDGCYLGAYILSDRSINGDISAFENIMEVEHAIYGYNMRLDSEYPQSFILSCIANEKTPVITIYPPVDGEKYDENALVKSAQAFGQFQIPMFIQFYPYSKQDEYNANRYKAFYRMAWELFSEYAPNTAFIWSVYYDAVFESRSFYPGNAYVDWIGLSIYANLKKSSENEIEYIKFENEFDFFYSLYQKDKPIFLSEFAASHYSTINNQYYTENAGNFIKSFYQSLVNRYPRVKAVIYMNMNFSELGGKDNYLITDEAELISAYKEATSGIYYLSEINEKTDNAFITNRDIYNSAYIAYGEGTDVWIPEKVLTEELLFTLESLLPMKNETIIMHSETYYPAYLIEKELSVYTERNDINKTLLISR